MPDVLVDHETEIDVLVEHEADVVLEQSEPEEIIVTEAVQGPPGPQGPQGVQGPIGDAGGAFLVTNRFGEIAADETAKQAARANLGLAVIDGGTFF